MTSQLKSPKVEKVHDLALGMFQHLRGLPDSAEKAQHIFRMICVVERAAAGVLDGAGADRALADIEAAGLLCQD